MSKELKRMVHSISIQTLFLIGGFLTGGANFQNPYGMIIPVCCIIGVIASIVIFIKASNKKRGLLE